MGLLRFIAVGAAIGYGINYITKKDVNGRSILDDLVEEAPQWFEKAKKFTEDTVTNVSDTVREKGAQYTEGY